MKKFTFPLDSLSRTFALAFLSLSVSMSAWATDYYVATTGNDGNPGTSGSPKLTIQASITTASTGDVIHVAAGTYNEDININKSVTITGASQAGTIIRGVINANTILISANNVTLSTLTVTRNYGATLTDWNNSPINQGINVGQFTTGTVIDNLLITGNRNGIYINNAPVTIQNSTISDNRTGVHFANNVSGSIVRNNFIQNNFTHGVLLNADTGTPSVSGLVASNVSVTNNSITGNWYSQVNFQHNNPAIPLGSTSGLVFNCNWYGTATPTANPINAAEPGYTAQTPSQFGGANPNLPDRFIVGLEAALVPFTPALSSGSDSDVQAGFQPVPGSCGSTPAVSALVVSGTLGNVSGCKVALSGVATGSSFTFTGPNGYVFSNVFRTAGTYNIVAEGIKDPGTYTLIINGDSSTAQTIQVTGTPCN